MNHSTDSEMMEADSAAAPPSSLPPPPSQVAGSSSDQNDVVRGLLITARHLIDQGKPSQALQAVNFRLFVLIGVCLFLLL